MFYQIRYVLIGRNHFKCCLIMLPNQYIITQQYNGYRKFLVILTRRFTYGPVLDCSSVGLYYPGIVFKQEL